VKGRGEKEGKGEREEKKAGQERVLTRCLERLGDMATTA